ncbi:PAS domain-containing protein [Phytohalomonas tamaricis]|uniref:PAS domain-containing protein n=1 Tax=Phytohalomonas tamaricis TaxID=2081032 RepID=UPI0021D42F45|nr:PAS domain-containing protein [Phytohalomonas tamaricis]
MTTPPPMISPELLERVVNASVDGIVVAEREGNEDILIYVNQGFEHLTGYSAEDILYRDCRFLQNGDNQQPGLDRLRKALAAGETCKEVIRNYRKDGSMFWNELSITPVHNDEDHLLYFIGIQKDVTDLVEAQQELEKLKSRLEND